MLFFVHLEQPPTVFIVARMGTKCLCLFLSDIAWVCNRELSGQQFAIENVVISYHIFLCKKEVKKQRWFNDRLFELFYLTESSFSVIISMIVTLFYQH